MGDTFTLADCALIPTLAQHGGAHPFTRFANITAYLGRALEWPSVMRVRREHDAYAAKVAS
jgi:glutathione S-transferase